MVIYKEYIKKFPNILRGIKQEVGIKTVQAYIAKKEKTNKKQDLLLHLKESCSKNLL